MSRYEKVDYAEYVEITDRLIAAYRDRLPDRGGSALDADAMGGEYGMMAEILVCSLVKHAVSVTAVDASDLRRLWYGTKGKTAPEDTIDRLVVTE